MTLGSVGWKREEDGKLSEVRSNFLPINIQGRALLDKQVFWCFINPKVLFPHEQKIRTPMWNHEEAGHSENRRDLEEGTAMWSLSQRPWQSPDTFEPSLYTLAISS